MSTTSATDLGKELLGGAIVYALRCSGRENLVLRPQQLEAIQQVCRGRDMFGSRAVWLPTGFGKASHSFHLLFTTRC